MFVISLSVLEFAFLDTLYKFENDIFSLFEILRSETFDHFLHENWRCTLWFVLELINFLVNLLNDYTYGVVINKFIITQFRFWWDFNGSVMPNIVPSILCELELFFIDSGVMTVIASSWFFWQWVIDKITILIMTLYPTGKRSQFNISHLINFKRLWCKVSMYDVILFM